MKSKKKALTPEEKLSQALLPREEWPYELPKGWVWTRLGVLSANQYGYTAKALQNADLPKFLRITDIQDGNINWGTVPNCKIDGKSLDVYKLTPEDIVIARTGATTGKSCFLLDLPQDTVFASFLIRLRVKPQICKYFIYLFLQSDLYWKQVIELSAGIAQPGVNSSKLKGIMLPLPPFPEQQRIVNKIESLFAKLDEAGDRLQKVLDGYEARRAAILHEAFSGKWTGDHGAGDMSVPKGWRKAAIKDICHRLSYGTSKKSLAEGKYIVIRMGNLQNGTIEWSNLAYSNDETEYAKYKLHPGDVLFNRTNSSELVGKTSIYKGEYPAIYAGYLIKLDYDRALINGEYLNYYLNSPRAKLYYNQVKTDGVNQSNINSKKIGNFKIAFPSMEEQNNIVSKLNHIFENDKKSLFLAKESLSKIDLMKKSILARAFRGELGTQDSSDPSALELLKECVLAGKEVSKS